MSVIDTVKKGIEKVRGYSRKPYTRDEQKQRNLSNRARKGSSDVEPWERRAADRVRAEAARKDHAKRVRKWGNRNLSIEVPHGVGRLDVASQYRRAPPRTSPFGSGDLDFSSAIGRGINFGRYTSPFAGISPAPTRSHVRPLKKGKGTKRRTTRSRDDRDPFRLF